MKKYSKELYSKEVIFKAAYAFTDNIYIHIDVDDKNYLIELESKNNDNTEILYDKFENELIAQETRRIVSEKTKNIREMIVARALSSTIVYESPDEEETDDEYNANEILTDWFKDEK